VARRSFGTVRKLSSGRWQARYSTSIGDRITAPHTFPTKAAAQRWLASIETDIVRGTWQDPTLGRTTVAEWSDRWLATKLPTVRRATADQYEYILRLHIVPHLGDHELGALNPVEIQAWLGMLHRSSDLAPNTVAKVYRLLKNMLGGAVEVGMIARNPCTIRGAGTERPPEIEVASPEQVAALADACGDYYRALIYVAAYGGLRWGELAGLQRRHIDRGQGVVVVEQKLSEVNGVLEIDAPKTAAGRRNVALPTVALDELVRHLDTRVGADRRTQVFTAADGGYLRRSNFRRRVWLPATETAGLPGLRFHDLRHTGATLAAATGAPLRAVMARMGHSTPAAALRYQHLIAGQDAEIARAMDAAEA
jgi:integrase